MDAWHWIGLLVIVILVVFSTTMFSRWESKNEYSDPKPGLGPFRVTIDFTQPTKQQLIKILGIDGSVVAGINIFPYLWADDQDKEILDPREKVYRNQAVAIQLARPSIDGPESWLYLVASKDLMDDLYLSAKHNSGPDDKIDTSFSIPDPQKSVTLDLDGLRVTVIIREVVFQVTFNPDQTEFKKLAFDLVV